MTAEEKEAAEEMMMDQMGGAGEGPQFVYVSKLKPEETAKLAHDAVESARARATLLAEAAGQKLGAVRALRSKAESSGGDAMSTYFEMMMEREGSSPKAGESEAVGATPGPVTYTFDVNVTYVLQGK
jgi:uncharacterized protein YggE